MNKALAGIPAVIIFDLERCASLPGDHPSPYARRGTTLWNSGAQGAVSTTESAGEVTPYSMYRVPNAGRSRRIAFEEAKLR